MAVAVRLPEAAGAEPVLDETELKVTVKSAEADAVPARAATLTAAAVVSGIVTTAVKEPLARVMNETLAEPAVRDPEVCLGNPMPLTVTEEPAGPADELRESPG